MVKRKYGLKRDLPDHRDHIYKSKFRFFLPRSVDLRPLCSPVENQGELGSCTANAIVGNLELLENKYKQSFIDLSRLFIYYNERLIEGTTDQDAGAMIRDGIKSLVKYGVCPEAEWPYDITQFTVKPTNPCYVDAKKNVISEYQRVQDVASMINCLASGFPVVIGISVFESFESATVAKTGIVPMPKSDESCLGGHAVLCVGFDMAKKWFIVKNSWGSGWGDLGFFYLPMDYVKKLSSDMWTISK